jgi:hypothetical protein
MAISEDIASLQSKKTKIQCQLQLKQAIVCCNPQCVNGIVVLDGDAVCMACGWKYCCVCHVPTSKEHIDQGIHACRAVQQKWANAKAAEVGVAANSMSICPSCCTLVEKTGGCDSMVCT